MSDPKAVPVSSGSSVVGCLLRVFWMAAGTIALVLIGVFIAQGRAWALSWGDIGYWILVVFMAAARALDVVRFAGTTVNGEPATAAHLRRYLIALPVAAACWWAVAHALALAGWLR